MRIVLVSILLAVLIAGCRNESPEKVTAGPRLLLISFDGFGHNYLEKAATPNLDTLLTEGVYAEGLKPVFPTKTFPNHFTIVTGLYPEKHGIVANEMYDPKWRKWFRLSNREAVSNGDWYEGEPIWNTIQKQGLRAGTMYWPGSGTDIQGMQPALWKPFDAGMSNTSRIDTVVKWLSYEDNRAINFGTLYFEFVDDTGHDYGLESDSLIIAIQEADRLIGYLKKQLIEKGIWNSMNIIIVSDHGMVDLAADKIIELDKIVDMDRIERITWAPMTMITPDSGFTDYFYQSFQENQGHYSVFKKEELPSRYHLKNHRRVQPIVLVADLGYTILEQQYKSRFLNSLPSANHGFDNKHKEMYGFFAARGPSFKSGVTVPSFQSIHLYEMMNHIMKTIPAENDGSIDSVRSLLKE